MITSLTRLRRRRPARAGFTVLEMMVALVVLSTGVLATTALLLGAQQTGARATLNDEALGIARRELLAIGNLSASAGQLNDDLGARSGDWNSHAGSDTDWVDAAAGSVEPVSSEDSMTVLRYVSCAEASCNASAGMRRLRVVVLAAGATKVALETTVDPDQVPLP